MRADRFPIQFILALSCVVALVDRFATAHMAAATLSYGCLVIGLMHRKYKRHHALWMTLGMLIDLLIVLSLEIYRDAIATAFAQKLGTLQQLHIAVSTVALLLYFPTATLGYMRLLRPDSNHSIKKFHIRLGIAAFIFRSLGFLLMFSMLTRT
jgi:hypothetical protein